MRLRIAEAAADRQPRGVGYRLRAALGTRRLRIAVAAAAFAAVAAAAVLFGLPHAPGPTTVSAAEVLERALSAYSSGRTWQADAVLKGAALEQVGRRLPLRRPAVSRRAERGWQLPPDAVRPDADRRGGADASADLRVTDDHAYDASTGVLRHLRPGRGLVVVKDYPLGPPDRWASPLTGVDFGATLRAMMAAGALKLEGTVLDGRPAWTVVTSRGAGVASPAGSAQGVDWPVYKVTVDKQTWLPVRFQEVTAGTSHGRVARPQRARQRAASRARVHAATAEGPAAQDTPTGASAASLSIRYGPSRPSRRSCPASCRAATDWRAWPSRRAR